MQPVSAHCPGTIASGGKDYAGAYQYVPSSDAIYAIIEWTNPTLCLVAGQDDFTLEGITLCNNTLWLCNGFVQTGWVRRETQGPTPKGYCEWQPVWGTFEQYHYAITQEQHTYWWNRVGQSSYWDCMFGYYLIQRIDLNFTSGTYITAQGETNSTHSTIGRSPHPLSILFWQMQYRAVPGYWYFTDLWDIIQDSPYFVYEPTPGQMRNGTYSH